jgi:beta-glucosidase
VNPSGRLPVTFPVSEAQLPHPKIQGDPNRAAKGPAGRGRRYGRRFAANASEGVEVGYKWFLGRREQPLFPFGYGLSYTTFALREVAAAIEGTRVTVSAAIANTGERAGVATAHFYVSGPEGSRIAVRLAGWGKASLAPGEERRVSASIDPRLFADFDEKGRRWRVAGGSYRLTAGLDSEHREQSATIILPAAELPP